MVTAEYPAGMAGQVIKKTELRRGGRDELSGDAQLHCAGINLDLLKAECRGCTRSFEPPQNSFDTSQELAGGERFCDVVVGAELESVDAIVFGGASGEEDDGDD